MAHKLDTTKLEGDYNSDSLKVLSRLWEEYDNLPNGAHKEYVWDECFDILSSLMRVLLKNAPANNGDNINDLMKSN